MIIHISNNEIWDTSTGTRYTRRDFSPAGPDQSFDRDAYISANVPGRGMSTKLIEGDQDQVNAVWAQLTQPYRVTKVTIERSGSLGLPGYSAFKFGEMRTVEIAPGADADAVAAEVGASIDQSNANRLNKAWSAYLHMLDREEEIQSSVKGLTGWQSRKISEIGHAIFVAAAVGDTELSIDRGRVDLDPGQTEPAPASPARKSAFGKAKAPEKIDFPTKPDGSVDLKKAFTGKDQD